MTIANRDTHPVPERRHRPFGVTVIAIIQIFSAIGWVIATIYGVPAYRELLGSVGYYDAAGPALALFSLLIAYGLFTLKRQAWVLTMLWTGLNLIAALYGWYSGEANYVAMVFGVITVYYLNQREVQVAFHVPLARSWYDRE